MKFCRDCKHYEPHHSGDADTRANLAKCGRSTAVTDLVTGTTRRRFCETERISNTVNTCGPEGRYFEPDDSDLIP